MQSSFWPTEQKLEASDAKYNDYYHTWGVSVVGCTSKYMLESVATHEFGHTFQKDSLGISLFHVVVWIGVGLAWWKVLGWW